MTKYRDVYLDYQFTSCSTSITYMFTFLLVQNDGPVLLGTSKRGVISKSTFEEGEGKKMTKKCKGV